MERLLININDVRAYRDLDPKYDGERFNAFLRDVQRMNLNEFLGDAMYYDFMQNITDANYANLLNGTTYTFQSKTVEYMGLKPILVFWWLAKAVREGDHFLVNYGNVEFMDNPQQNYQNAKTKEIIAGDHMISASRYQNKAIQFLDENKTDYPLWESKKKVKGTNFTTFKL